MDMESIKRLLEQMLNQVGQQNIGPQNDAYEIIGKLEQLKAYFSTKAMHSTMFPGIPSVQSVQPPQPAPIVQQTNVLNQPMMPQTQPADILPQMEVEQHIQNQAALAQPAGQFLKNPCLWQVVDEDMFDYVHEPVPWFSKLIDSEKLKIMFTVPPEHLADFIKLSPPLSYAQSPLFTGMSLPVTLKSKNLLSIFRGAPGLLVHGGGEQADIYWPAVGKYFEIPTVVGVSYEWRVQGIRYMLIIRIDVQDQAGPAEAGQIVPFGAGPSGTGQSVHESASKRPRH